MAELRTFVGEVERLIPPRVKAAIAAEVTVSFAGLDERREILPPACNKSTNPDAPQELAAVTLSRNPETPHQVVVHAGLKPIIAAGRERATHYACGHRSLYQLAVATLLHEVLHVYDARAGLSHNPRFHHLVRFAPQGFLRQLEARNELVERSPDPYEFQDARESLAVNGEYFLLDPEFRCRRPALYQFLESALGYRPFPHFACRVNGTVYAQGQPLRIDPDRVYEVHYLVASRGPGIGSRFGHAMFRLVMCAEERSRVGPECLNDVQDHIVLGFAANLRGDRAISPWKGLTGGYLSQLYVKPLSEVIIDYTEREFRDLDSLPLRFDDDEKRRFVHRALETYWSYQGRYFFLTNNCAVESLSLLKSVLDSPAVHAIERITPLGLRDALLQLGIAAPIADLDAETAERNGLRFPSLFAKYDAEFRQLSAHLPRDAPHDLRGYLAHTQALARRRWVQALQGSQALTQSARAFALEGLILSRTVHQAEQLIIRFVNRHLRDPRQRELLSHLEALLQLLASDVPWRRARSGYGIPLEGELRQAENATQQRLMQRLLGEAFQILREQFPAEYAEWQRTQENRRLILNRLSTASAALRDRFSSGGLP